MKNRIWSHRDFLIRRITDNLWCIYELRPDHDWPSFSVAEIQIDQATSRLAAQRQLDKVIRERNAWYTDAPLPLPVA